MKKFKASVFIISLTIIGLLVVTGCSQSNQNKVQSENHEETTEKIPVEVLEVKKKDFTSELPNYRNY